MTGPKPRILMEGVAFPESPRWHDGRLWFSDWVAHQVIALDPEGGSEVMAQVDAFPFSIDWLPDGPMLITAGRELLRMEADGSLVTHAISAVSPTTVGTRSSSTASGTPMSTARGST